MTFDGLDPASGTDRVPVRHPAPRLALLAIAIPLAAGPAPAPDTAGLTHPREGANRMNPPLTGSLLASYYNEFLRDHDLERFRERVSSRYGEGTLARLAQAGEIQARRAAVLALGLNGTFEVNEAVGRALADEDPTVRSLAENALWAIWFRADTPENNEVLEEVRTLNNRSQTNAAILLATRLIARAPKFAEAYNQRAIAHFMAGRFEQSALDCERVLELNPYHIGALSGLGRCYLHLDRNEDALRTFERALKIQPFDDNLKQTVAALRLRGQ